MSKIIFPPKKLSYAVVRASLYELARAASTLDGTTNYRLSDYPVLVLLEERINTVYSSNVPFTKRAIRRGLRGLQYESTIYLFKFYQYNIKL